MAFFILHQNSIKMKFIPILITLVFIITACKPEGRVYEKHKKLSPDVEWLKKDIRTFEVPIEDTSARYNLSLTFRYAQGYRHKNASVVVTETAPDGSTSSAAYDLKIRDEEGKYIGDPGYDIWDSQHTVETGKTYSQKGVYTYKIEQDMPVDPLNYAMEIGLIVDKVK